MKQVLIIDESPLCRDFLQQKLEENGIEVGLGLKVTDGISKMRTMAPDLIFLDYHLSGHGFMEVLKQKKADPNTANTPVVIMANKIEQKHLIQLVPYGVKKVFTKPIKIDALFNTMSELLGVKFKIDDTPSIVDAHINENIIFIEIAQGLNRDKLDLLRCKIAELLELYRIKIPKVIIMFSDIRLSHSDAINLQRLLNAVMQASGARLRHIRILTREDYVRNFIENNKEYSGIEVVSNLQYAMDDLMDEVGSGFGSDERKAELLGDRLLKAGTKGDAAMAMKFEGEAKSARLETVREAMQNLHVAVIDDDIIIQELIKNIFSKTGARVSTFSNGQEFLNVIDKEVFDLAFLDLVMPKLDGFGVLNVLQTRHVEYPIIVLSAISQRETMIKAIQMGIKSYLIKPIKPEDVFNKSIEILRVNF